MLQAKGGTTVLVAAGDSINSIANQHGCTKYEIMEWNQLRDENLYFHQELVLFVIPPTPRCADRNLALRAKL
ncbi:MAG: LysM peptidoglycan-binding domain-containing protein [Saprospirales bacterium]|nr:LysM peptidoglycan-binding domain-containing protein [Saprospirales bacterium]